MVTKTALYPEISVRQKILNSIPQHEFKYILKREKLKKDLITGWIGERGGGKSGSCAVVGIVDFMMGGVPCHSNMKIALDLQIDVDTLRKYLTSKEIEKYDLQNGGTAKFHSLPIDMPALLRFDEKYRNTHILLDEINVEIADARRAMSNTNLFSNRLAQELRHLEASISFTCISEMAIDPRWRDIVDMFVRCEESAYSPENIEAGKERGVDFKWLIYYMNRCFNGTTYADTKKAVGPVFFHFEPWHGVYNDKEFQGQGMTKYGVDMKAYDESVTNGTLTIQDGSVVKQFKDNLGWLDKIYNDMVMAGEKYVLARDIANEPDVLKHRMDSGKLSEHLNKYYGIRTATKQFNGEPRRTYYVIPDSLLKGE